MAQSVTDRRASTVRVPPTAPQVLGTADAEVQPHGRPGRGMPYWPESLFFEGRFGRMFRTLPALPLTPSEAKAIAARMVEDPSQPSEGNNPRITAGYTYLGQFIDHDLTFDPNSSLQKRNDPDALRNFRSPAFDLDSVYGRGPDDQPYMYDGTGRFLLGRGQRPDELDLPRNNPPGLVDDPSRDVPRRALIGDPRNDQQILVSQLHLTMLVFHNRVMDLLEGRTGAEPVPELERMARHLEGKGWRARFDAAQDIVRWHYQWVVVFDFLRLIVGEETLDMVFEPTQRRDMTVRRPNLEHYQPRYAPYMPVEFAVAAYRFGHSMVRNSYRLNTLVPPEGGRLMIFDRDADPGSAERLTHLGGNRQLPPFWPIEWRFFFDMGDVVEPPPFIASARRIDTHVAAELSELPANVATGIAALPERNLLRGATMGLPSGQAVAEAMDLDPMSDEMVGLDGAPAPLWYYVLKEAEMMHGGEHLGPVGGRIVAEVFIGLLTQDPSSWYRARPSWRPFLPAQRAGSFTMADLIAFSGYGLEVVSA